MRKLFLTITTCLLVSNVVHAQTNLVTNPSFEETGQFSFPWNAPLVGDVDLNGTINFMDIPAFIAVLQSGTYQLEADVNGDNSVTFTDIAPFIELLQGSGSTFSIANDNSVEGDQSLVAAHGNHSRTSGFSQLAVVPVVAGRSYIFSASVLFEDGAGQARLIVRPDGGSDLVNQAFPATSQVWEKAQVRFTATGNTQVRLFLRTEQSTGNTYFDAVKLFEVDGESNLIANQDFETNGNWTRQSGASYSTAEKRFGVRSMRLNGSSSSFAVQNISLGVDTDKPIYTLSAHIKTTGTVPAPVTDVDWAAPSEVGNEFSTVDFRGAGFKVDFFDGGTNIRTSTHRSFSAKRLRLRNGSSHSFLQKERRVST